MDKLKFYVGLAGAVVVAAVQVWGPDGTVGKALTVVAAVLTAVGVYMAKNQPSVTAR
jgi:hypothetical protein